MNYDLITTDEQLGAFCADIAGAPRIAFDTEFVSERTYRPQLCLVQVAVGGRLAVIDTLEVTNLVPFWKLLATGSHETIVHAGREEVCFCLEAVGKPPAALFDVQIAAGLVGHEYPAGYGNLLSKLLGIKAAKKETRTDWSKRPLSDRQMDYALDDVRDLERLRDKLHARLSKLERLSWLEAEMTAWIEQLIASREEERWRRVSGIAGLGSRELAIVRELWRWREGEARRRDWPPRRLLRDDLIVEMAKRHSDDPKQIRAVRGMERGDLQRQIGALAAAVRTALDLPDDHHPPIVRGEAAVALSMVTQFLASAVSSICRAAHVAPSIVGTASDVRDLIAYRLGGNSRGGEQELPMLMQGWRAEVVGNVLDDLLAGRLSIRIAEPTSDHPLEFLPVDGEAPKKRRHRS